MTGATAQAELFNQVSWKNSKYKLQTLMLTPEQYSHHADTSLFDTVDLIPAGYVHVLNAPRLAVLSIWEVGLDTKWPGPSVRSSSSV